MPQTLMEKTLLDRGKLELIRYELGLDVAGRLGRPVGTFELILNYSDVLGGVCTSPGASHYITEEFYRKLFDKIQSQDEFDEVKKDLDKIGLDLRRLVNKNVQS